MLCFLLKEKDRVTSLAFSAFDTHQFSIQILLTMIVQLWHLCWICKIQQSAF